jgi:hypothetical protein
MLALKPSETLTLEPGIVLHSLPQQDWYYAFSVITGDQFRLNKTSFWVLENISDGIEWVHLRDSFLITFEVSAEQGEVDLLKLVNEMYEQNIIGRQGHGKEKD